MTKKRKEAGLQIPAQFVVAMFYCRAMAKNLLNQIHKATHPEDEVFLLARRVEAYCKQQQKRFEQNETTESVKITVETIINGMDVLSTDVDIMQVMNHLYKEREADKAHYNLLVKEIVKTVERVCNEG